MKIIVSDKWLKTCGEERLSGVPLEVEYVRDFGERRGKFYHVRLPNGNTWAVWDARGVTEIQDYFSNNTTLINF